MDSTEVHTYLAPIFAAGQFSPSKTMQHMHLYMNLLLMKKHIGSNQGRARMSAFPRPVHRIHMLQDSSIASSMDSSESSWLLYILFSPKLSMLLCRGITQHHREAPNSKLDSSNS
jgi:hypothetical protein